MKFSDNHIIQKLLVVRESYFMQEEKTKDTTSWHNHKNLHKISTAKNYKKIYKFRRENKLQNYKSNTSSMNWITRQSNIKNIIKIIQNMSFLKIRIRVLYKL